MVNDSRPSFEVICPVYNEGQTVPLFFERIKTVFEQLSPKYRCFLRFVDNCSQDNTYSLVKELAEKFDWVSVVVMSRNFGYQCSVECGIRNSNADFTAVVDVDCEDPPELFIEFLKWCEKGYEIVYGERLDREEGELLKFIRKIYYRLTKFAADEHFILDMAEFSVISRMVREVIIRDHSSFPFIRASIGRVGFQIKNIPYKRHARIAGETHYNFWRMFVFGVAGILASSTLWLRVPIFLFPFWFVLTTGFFIDAIKHSRATSFYAMVYLTALYFAFILTGVSLYLARTYKNGLRRPNYIINSKISLVGNQKLN